VTKELERFAKIEPRTQDETDAPDPFLPPPEKKAPIILDLSDQEHRVTQQAAREEKAQQVLQQARVEREERLAPREIVEEDDRSLRLWYATAAMPVGMRLAALGGALGLTAILALAATPIFWLFAPIVIAWFGSTFFVRRT
jgi:hypothetical protein